MARTEAPASSESRRQQQLTTPAATAPLLNSTSATVFRFSALGSPREHRMSERIDQNVMTSRPLVPRASSRRCASLARSAA